MRNAHYGTPAYDHAGNMIDDGTFVYVYDAWNRLIKARAKEDADVTIQTAEFDALGRRIKKVVTNAGDYEKTELYYYDGQRIIETRNGSNAVVSQFIHGTQYIDELVMMRVKDKGDLYVHQDASWNVIGTTDLGRHVVERNVYTPYGELTVHQDTGFGDRDGDADVDSTDKGTVGVTCTGTVTGSCRILDLDFDGDYDSTDAGLFDSLMQGSQRHPGRPATATSQPFAHQGLLFEPELAQYQNRARQYDPGKRLFVQRDPLNRIARPVLQKIGLNLYDARGSSPTTRFDPSGLCWMRGLSVYNASCAHICDTNPCASVAEHPYACTTCCCNWYTDYNGLRADCIAKTCAYPPYYTVSQCARNCIDEHETIHRTNMKCGNDGPRICGGHACGPVSGYDYKNDECDACLDSVNCLTACLGQPAPPGEIEDLLEAQKSCVEKKCPS